ncbi:MAG: HEAT repeat domain-containing protein [Bacteroidia bacterium]|nr:HEAT repeat domain-containing protein [Bacteroidia bacterium]
MNKIKYYILFAFSLGVCFNAFSQTESKDIFKQTKDFASQFLFSTELLIRVCAVLLILFIILFIGFFLTLMIARTIHRRNDSYEKRIKEKFELLLTGIIFIDEGEMETREWRNSKQRVMTHFRSKYLNSKKNKKFLREHIILMHKNFNGFAAEVLRNLYLEFRLQKGAIRELNAPDWGIQAMAVKELAQLNIDAALKQIKRLTTHENEILRLEAQIAVLSLDKVEPFAFLNKIKFQLTNWHQVNLANAIRQLETDKLPQFSQWFSSNNDSVVLFSIKMAQLFDQFESIPLLVKLLEHKSQKIVGESARVLGVFMANDAQENLLKAFRNAEHEVKLKILIALGKCGTDEIIPFLSQQLLQNDAEIAFTAGKALKLIGFSGRDVLEQNKNSILFDVPNICNHLLDDRI